MDHAEAKCHDKQTALKETHEWIKKWKNCDHDSGSNRQGGSNMGNNDQAYEQFTSFMKYQKAQ